MSRRAAAAIAILGVALLGGCGEEDDRVEAGAPDFVVELPAGWEEQDAGQREELGEAGVEGLDIPEEAQFTVDVQALWALEEPSDEFTTNVNVVAEELPEELTVEEYLDITAKQLEATSFASDIGPQTPGPQVDGESSGQLDYSGEFQGTELRWRLITAIHEGSAYNITLTAPPAGFKEASGDLDEIVASWSWD